MKRISLFLLLLSILISCAGMEKALESELTIQKVFEAPGFSKDHIYNQTKIWIAQNFRSSKAVIEHDDKESGLLIGNGIIQYPCKKGLDCLVKADWKVRFTIRVDVKNERFRLTFKNLSFLWPEGNEIPVSIQSDIDIIKPELLNFGDQIILSLKQSKQKDSW